MEAVICHKYSAQKPSTLALLHFKRSAWPGAFSESVSLNAAVGGYLTNYMIADDPRLPNGGWDPSPALH